MTMVTDALDQGILKALESWRKSWSSRDVAGYLAAYVPDFHGDSPSREDWRKERETRIANAGEIAVQVSDTQVQALDGKRARVQFRQNYRARNYQDETWKTLLMVLDQGRWLIREERAGR
jgi:ketosteroid isomerase-like protein